MGKKDKEFGSQVNLIENSNDVKKKSKNGDSKPGVPAEKHPPQTPHQVSISSTFYVQFLHSQIPKLQKKYIQSFFALLGSVDVKAEPKMKLTPELTEEVNATKQLRV